MTSKILIQVVLMKIFVSLEKDPKKKLATFSQARPISGIWIIQILNSKRAPQVTNRHALSCQLKLKVEWERLKRAFWTNGNVCSQAPSGKQGGFQNSPPSHNLKVLIKVTILKKTWRHNVEVTILYKPKQLVTAAFLETRT